MLLRESKWFIVLGLLVVLLAQISPGDSAELMKDFDFQKVLFPTNFGTVKKKASPPLENIPHVFTLSVGFKSVLQDIFRTRWKWRGFPL